MFGGLIDDIRKFASLVLTVVLIGYLTLFVVGIAGFIYTILAILAMNKGEDFVVPLNKTKHPFATSHHKGMFFIPLLTNQLYVQWLCPKKHNHVPQVLLHIYK